MHSPLTVTVRSSQGAWTRGIDPSAFRSWVTHRPSRHSLVQLGWGFRHPQASACTYGSVVRLASPNAPSLWRGR